ncbi:hypothetical protein ACWAUC_15005 [Bradyrhizobium guangdongense]
MAAITRKEIESLQDILIFTKKQTVDAESVGYFLHLFHDGQPLQKEDVLEWQELPPNGVQADYIRKCFELALNQALIEERDGGFYLTAAGEERAGEVVPEGPFMG